MNTTREVASDVPPPTPWMSSVGAAKYLGITGSSLYRLIDDGVLPAYRFGRVIRLKLPEIDEYVQRSRIKTGDLAYVARESRKPRDGADADSSGDSAVPLSGSS